MSPDPPARLRRAGLALGGGVFLLVLLAGAGLSLVLIPIRWYEAGREARDDPARCPSVDHFAHTEVDLGGWAEPDTCAYFGPNGEQVELDGTFAGPVLRHRRLIPPNGGPVAVAGLCVVVSMCGLAVVIARQRADASG